MAKKKTISPVRAVVRPPGVTPTRLDGIALKLSKQADANLQKWGLQDRETLALAIAEECGELAQAILQLRHEGGEMYRVSEESVDLGSLCVQMILANEVLM